MNNERNTLSLVRHTQDKGNESAMTDEQYALIANSLTPEEQNGNIILNQESISDDDAILMANKLSPELQNHQDDNQRGHLKNRSSDVQVRFKSRSHEASGKRQTVDARNATVALEVFEMPKPELDCGSERADRNTGERFHGSGFMGRNRKRRLRQYEEEGIADNQQCETPKVAVNENPLGKWL